MASGEHQEANAFVCSADAKLRRRQKGIIYKTHAGKRLLSRVILNAIVNKIHAFCCERAQTHLPMNGYFLMLCKYSVSFHVVIYKKLPTEKLQYENLKCHFKYYFSILS